MHLRQKRRESAILTENMSPLSRKMPLLHPDDASLVLPNGRDGEVTKRISNSFTAAKKAIVGVIARSSQQK